MSKTKSVLCRSRQGETSGAPTARHQFRGQVRPVASYASACLIALSVMSIAGPASADASLWVEGGAKGKPIQIPSVAPLVERVEPASLVVFTRTSGANMLPPGHPALGPSEGPPAEIQGQGSGFLIHPSGLALTNHHVVENALALWVQVGKDHREIQAKVIGSDKKSDVALLQLIDPKRKKPWPYVPLGDSAKLAVGDFVVAIGNPFGLAQTVSMGILSARHRKNIAPSGRVGLYDFLQTDASINVGNSGGPLLNLRGEVIGINTAVNAAASGIGFAIPINMVKGMLPSLKRDGRVVRSWIGVSIQPISREIASGLGLDRARGALIRRVIPEGPGGLAGLIAGDIVVGFDGESIEDASDLPLIAGARGAGSKIKLDVIRNKKAKVVQITLGVHPDSTAAKKAPPKPIVEEKRKLGLKVSPLKQEDRNRLHLNVGSKGILVIDVAPGSPAMDAGLQKDDILVGLDDTKVKTARDFATKVKAAKSKAVLRLLIVRDGATVFVPLVKP